MRINVIKYIAFIACFFIFIESNAQPLNDQRTITLNEALVLAQMNDPWFVANSLKQKAASEQGIATVAWDNPKMSLGLANLPTDTLNFGQEAMTQLKVGVSQMLPRGNSLDIKQSIADIESSQFSLMAAERRAKINSIVSEHWLSVYLAQQSIELIKKNKTLFEQLVEIAHANYASAADKTKQQDIIHSQLELIQLEDKLIVYQQQFSSALAILNQWLTSDAHNLSHDSYSDRGREKVAESLPKLTFIASELEFDKTLNSSVIQELSNHPALLIIEAKRAAAKQHIALTKEKLKPQWGVNAAYAYRDKNALGDKRSDFFSVGFTFDMPIFTEHKQNKAISSAVYQAEAIKTEQRILLKQMVGQVEKELHQLNSLRKRQRLYQESLLSRTDEQAEATLAAYMHADGGLSDVIRAKTAALTMRISALEIDVNVLKSIARLNYFFTRTEPALAAKEEL